MGLNAESQAQSARTAKDGKPVCSDNSRGERSSGGGSGQTRDIGFRVDRTTSERSNFLSPSIAGKIITQLIREAEGQLENARACIKWYEDEEEKALAKIEELRRLEESVQAEDEMPEE
jgi:hypothetical protein